MESEATEQRHEGTSETAAATSVASNSRPYETFSLEDFERAMKISYETSEATVSHRTTETSPALPRTSSPALPRISSPRSEQRSLTPSNALENADPEPTLERQLFVFQGVEAAKRVEAEEYEAAAETIVDIIQNPTITPTERSQWIVERADCLQMLGRWKDSLEELFDDAWTEGCGTRNLARGTQCVAEALFQVGEHAKAKETCLAALRIWEKRKSADDDSKVAFYTCVELMARIAEAMGKKVEAMFYRSKVVEGYVSKAALRQRARQEADDVGNHEPRERSKNEDGSSSKVLIPIREEPEESVVPMGGDEILRNQMKTLREFGLHCYWDPGSKSVLLGDKEDPLILELYRSTFKEAIESKDEWKVECLLLDKNYARTSKVIYYAIINNHMESMKALIEMGVGVNSSITLDERDGAPDGPLSLAVSTANEEAVRYLLLRGANANGSDIEQRFDLGAAARTSKIGGTSPLHEAVGASSLALLDLLISARAKTEKLNFRGYTPLHEAIRLFNPKIAGRLLMAGASARTPSYPNCDTPLHLALKYQPVQLKSLVEDLLKKGANPEAKNKNGFRPIDMCTGGGAEGDSDEMKKIEFMMSMYIQARAEENRRLDEQLKASKEKDRKWSLAQRARVAISRSSVDKAK